MAGESAPDPLSGLIPNTKTNTFKAGEKIDWDQYSSRWEKLWDKGLKPGELFDEGKASAVFTSWLASDEGRESVAGKRAFVPGCGRGYDVAALAAAGAELAVGLELAPTAAADAQRWLHEESGLAPEQLAATRVQHGDFFSHQGGSETADSADGERPYDLGYDYTFLCALAPDMRPAWVATWARLFAPGTGRLVTLIFPVGKDPNEGPPWGVTPQLYEQMLEKDFVCEHLAEAPKNQSHPSREGREWLGVWRRRGSSEGS